MNLNEKLVSLYKNSVVTIRNSEAYKLNRSKIENELIARCSNGNTTHFCVNDIDPSVVAVLADDLRAEGLRIAIINGHGIEASIDLSILD